MPNSTLLIPGTGGITFIDNNGNDIGYPAKMALSILVGELLGKTPEELVELLCMEHLSGQIAPFKTSLKNGLSIRPGHKIKLAYNQIPAGWNTFMYDWRADLRHSAQQLLDFIIQRKPTNGRWNLVGHSQGGLLIVVASKILPSPDAFVEHVASVTLVGAPLAGTVNAAQALIKGDMFGEAAVPAFKQIVRSWPSIHQMLPAWPSVFDTQGNKAADIEQINQASAWSAYDNIIPDLFIRAAAVQGMLEHPFDFMLGNIDKTVLLARQRHTPVRIERDGQGLFDADKLPKQLGDTLVPFDATQRWIGPSNSRHIVQLTGAVNEHSRLFNDGGVIAQINNFIHP